MPQFSEYRPPVPLTILSFFPLRHFHFVNSLRNSLRHSPNQCLDIYSLGSYSEKEVFLWLFFSSFILSFTNAYKYYVVHLPISNFPHPLAIPLVTLLIYPLIYSLGSALALECFLEIFIRSYLHIPILCISPACSIDNIVLLSPAPFPFRKLVEKFP